MQLQWNSTNVFGIYYVRERDRVYAEKMHRLAMNWTRQTLLLCRLPAAGRDLMIKGVLKTGNDTLHRRKYKIRAGARPSRF